MDGRAGTLVQNIVALALLASTDNIGLAQRLAGHDVVVVVAGLLDLAFWAALALEVGAASLTVYFKRVSKMFPRLIGFDQSRCSI